MWSLHCPSLHRVSGTGTQYRLHGNAVWQLVFKPCMPAAVIYGEESMIISSQLISTIWSASSLTLLPPLPESVTYITSTHTSAHTNIQIPFELHHHCHHYQSLSQVDRYNYDRSFHCRWACDTKGHFSKAVCLNILINHNFPQEHRNMFFNDMLITTKTIQAPACDSHVADE